MRIGFTGTREGLTCPGGQWNALRWWLEANAANATEFRHGVCVGADEEADQIIASFVPHARRIGHPPTDRKLISHRAESQADELCEPLPYLMRNRVIVIRSDILLACPKDDERDDYKSGTWSTVRYARKLHVPVVLSLPDGEVRDGRSQVVSRETASE